MMDPFFQWIEVPDDRPSLPPVDEDICGLKDFSSLGNPTDHHIDQGYGERSSGLLLGPDLCHNVYQGADTFDAITVSYAAPELEQHAFFSSPSQPSYPSLFPPALSPDSSPTSVASSTPWLRTPESDPSVANAIASFTPMDALWDIAEAEEEQCNFFDQLGNILEDFPSQVQHLMPEDIACTPQVFSDPSLPRVINSIPCGRVAPVAPASSSHTPTFIISPLPVSRSPTRALPLGPVHGTSLPPSLPHKSQSLFAFSPIAPHPQETPLPGYDASPSLSPLTTLSFFSQSPSASPNPSPLVNCIALSPAPLPVPLPNSDERVQMPDFVSSAVTGVTSAKLQGKRSAGMLDCDAPPWKIPRRAKAKNVDEEEWNPEIERAKRPRTTRHATTPDLDHPSDKGSEPEGHTDATQTTCEICGQTFTRASDYIRHIENSSSHPDTRKVWPCPYCESALGRKDALSRHIRTIHPGRPVVIPDGVPESQLPDSQKEPFVRRIGQRKVPTRKHPGRRR